MKNKQIRILVFLFCMLTVIPLMATETRVGSMGGVGFYIRDNSNIFYFPGTLLQYQNQAVAELRAKNSDHLYTVGIHLERSPSSTYGVYLNRPLALPHDVIDAVVPALRLDRCTTLFYGGQSSGYDYGILLSVAMDKDEEDSGTETEKQGARYFGLNAGISTDVYDLGLQVDLPNAKWEYGDEEDKWSGIGIGLNGRYFSQRTSNMEAVLLAVLYYGSAGREWEAEDLEVDYGKLKLGLGGAINYQIGQNNMLVLAVEAIGYDKDNASEKDGDEITYTVTTLPGIYIGVEAQVKSWLIGRLGARQVYQSISEKTKPDVGDETEDVTYSSSFGVSFGLGILFGSLQLDAQFNEGILFDGPNFISGYDNALANRISMTYHFNNPGGK
jgi:hypothetical protein